MFHYNDREVNRHRMTNATLNSVSNPQVAQNAGVNVDANVIKILLAEYMSLSAVAHPSTLFTSITLMLIVSESS